MSIDFIVFVSLIFIGLIYILNNSKKLFLLYLTLLIVFIIAIRIDPKGVDFVQYYRYLHNVEGFRYYREIVYFSIGLVLYKILHNEIITFILMDFVWIYVLFLIQQEINMKFKKKDYAFVIILFTSFPLFFGYENIYRQLFAEIFSLYAYSIREKKVGKSNLFFLVAILMHNTSLVILPFLILKKFFNFNFNLRLFLATSLAISFDFLFSIASHYKSGHNTGMDTSVFYLLIFFILTYIFIIKNKFDLFIYIKKFPSVYIGLILMIGLKSLPISMDAERMGIFFLIFVIYDLYVYSCTMQKNRQQLFRIGLLLIFSLPVILFNSSRIML